MNPFWTTAKGEQIPYEDLEDAHLKNLVRDGYRNAHIVQEAQRRGFKVPTREVDKLSIQDHMMWLECFNSCAIEGNELGEEIARLWDENKALYMLKLNRLIEYSLAQKE